MKLIILATTLVGSCTAYEASDESTLALQQVNDVCIGQNLALLATAWAPAGGVSTPDKMNDEEECTFYTPPSNTIADPQIQYTWTRGYNILSFVIRTHPYGDASGLVSGTVQYHDDLLWHTHGTFTSSSSNIVYTFDDCIVATAIRVIDLDISNADIYDWSVCECNPRTCGSTSTNLAPFATASSSDGGVGGSLYGIHNLNDLEECLWFWTRYNDGWIQYSWQYPIYVEQFKLYTDEACILNTKCEGDDVSLKLGRGVASGTVQYSIDGAEWITDGSFTSTSEIIAYKMTSCTLTQNLRILDIAAHNCTDGLNTNPVVYEWQVCTC